MAGRLDPSSFIERTSTSISVDWRGIGELVIGSFLLVLSIGYTSLVQSVSSALAGMVAFVGSLYAGLITEIIMVPLTAGLSAWDAATGFLNSLGPAAPIAATALALVVLYAYTEAIDG